VSVEKYQHKKAEIIKNENCAKMVLMMKTFHVFVFKNPVLLIRPVQIDQPFMNNIEHLSRDE
jgi:hypothetical protein